MHKFHSLLTRPVSVLVCLVTLAAPFSATVAYAASERIAPPGASTRLPEHATRLGKCPPGQTAYTDGTSMSVKCMPAPSCGMEQSRNAAGKCVCPPGKIAVRHGSEPDKVECVPAPPCAAGQTRDATTGECRCPPGQTSYRSGSGGAPKCVLARSCPPAVKFDSVTGQCQCPGGTKVYWDGAGGGGCVP
jgi:hypothetical protein